MVFDAGIVLYNPSPENIQCIQQWINARIFKTVTIYDNSESNNHMLFDPDILADDNVKYVFSEKNNALAVPYNQLIEQSIQSSTDYLCILDQDSEYPVSEIKNMMAYINHNEEQLKKYAIISPRSYARGNYGKERENCLTDAEWVINSGSFLNINFLHQNELKYDENIFLDGLDFDFCWTARELGGRVGIYEGSVLIQALGESSIKEESKWGGHHSAFRYYLIAKNKKYIWKKHKGFLGTLMAFASNIRLLGKVLLFEDDRWTKFKSCLKGCVE